jgi:hypothetical protein
MTRMNAATRPTIEAVLVVPEVKEAPRQAGQKVEEGLGLGMPRCGMLALVRSPDGVVTARQWARRGMKDGFASTRRSARTVELISPTFPDLDDDGDV